MIASADSYLVATDSTEATRRERETFAGLELGGLRIVVVASNCRAATLRTLWSARWLHHRGAEVMFLDTGSQDGTLDAIRMRFSFVRALDVSASSALLSDLAIEYEGFAARAPRWVLQCAPGSWLDRFEVKALIREIDQLPAGRFLVSDSSGGELILARCHDLARLGGVSSAVPRFVRAGGVPVDSGRPRAEAGTAGDRIGRVEI